MPLAGPDDGGKKGRVAFATRPFGFEKSCIPQAFIQISPILFRRYHQSGRRHLSGQNSEGFSQQQCLGSG